MSNYTFPVVFSDGLTLHGVYHGVSGIHCDPLFDTFEGLLDLFHSENFYQGKDGCDCVGEDVIADGQPAKACRVHKYLMPIAGEVDE